MLILGSGSLGRKELLKSVGLIPDKVVKPDIDETAKVNERPENYVKRIAMEKSDAIHNPKNSLLITADTVVIVGRRILMKTSDENRAQEYLSLLSGRRHNVFTAFCVKYNDQTSLNLVKTSLKMKLLNEEEIQTYIDSREWVGCAGAYSLQGRAKAFFPFISGCFSNVIGLPIPKLISVLNGLGYSKNKNEKRNIHR